MNLEKITPISFQWTDQEHKKHAINIRTKVFVEEQNVAAELELDGDDTNCIHILLYDEEGKALATARLKYLENNYIKFERFAVLFEFRGMNLGEKLVHYALELTKNSDKIYLHAQEQVIDFYKKFGFKETGNFFTEADIRHKKMVYKKS